MIPRIGKTLTGLTGRAVLIAAAVVVTGLAAGLLMSTKLRILPNALRGQVNANNIRSFTFDCYYVWSFRDQEGGSEDPPPHFDVFSEYSSGAGYCLVAFGWPVRSMANAYEVGWTEIVPLGIETPRSTPTTMRQLAGGASPTLRWNPPAVIYWCGVISNGLCYVLDPLTEWHGVCGS